MENIIYKVTRKMRTIGFKPEIKYTNETGVIKGIGSYSICRKEAVINGINTKTIISHLDYMDKSTEAWGKAEPFWNEYLLIRHTFERSKKDYNDFNDIPSKFKDKMFEYLIEVERHVEQEEIMIIPIDINEAGIQKLKDHELIDFEELK